MTETARLRACIGFLSSRSLPDVCNLLHIIHPNPTLVKISPDGFSGSSGDFSTLFPLEIGYVAVSGLNPAGLFIILGLTNIALGLIYRLPMPLQPRKVIAGAIIAQRWSPSIS